MAPSLLPGDWLLVDPLAYRVRSPRVGEIVVVPDPREPARWLIKRVDAVEGDGRLRLAGDAPAASTDSRVFGTVAPESLLGRAWLRYWPPRRFGPLRTRLAAAAPR
jgi:nickel-type superoxide dismutase maturation protease